MGRPSRLFPVFVVCFPSEVMNGHQILHTQTKILAGDLKVIEEGRMEDGWMEANEVNLRKSFSICQLKERLKKRLCCLF